MDKDIVFGKIQLLVMGVMTLIALSILGDFELGNTIVEEEVLAKNRVLENRYNPGRNYYYANHLSTENFMFPVSQEFASGIEKGQRISLKISPLYREVNQVKNIATGSKETFSFRWFTGLMLPLVAIVIFWLGFKRRSKLNTLVFVAEVVLLINFIYHLN